MQCGQVLRQAVQLLGACATASKLAVNGRGLQAVQGGGVAAVSCRVAVCAAVPCVAAVLFAAAAAVAVGAVAATAVTV